VIIHNNILSNCYYIGDWSNNFKNGLGVVINTLEKTFSYRKYNFGQNVKNPEIPSIFKMRIKKFFSGLNESQCSSLNYTKDQLLIKLQESFNDFKESYKKMSKLKNYLMESNILKLEPSLNFIKPAENGIKTM
jgi:hypothetical protein